MKQNWTRLAALFKVKNNQVMDLIFQRHHKHADEMIIDSSGNVMAAVYFTPCALDKMHTKSIFREIQKRTSFACEDQP